MEYRFSNKIANLKPSAIREILKAPSDADTISFAAGNPSPEAFPVKELAELAQKIFEEEPVAALQYSVTDGYGPLRKAIADRQKKVFGIGRDFDNTIVVSGGQQGIELLCKVMCNEGDAVAVENPSFVGALNAFRSCGARTIGVPLSEDDSGLDTDALEETLSSNADIRFLYVIPTFQNPAGTTTTLEKRKKIYEICLRHGVLILEDNPYGELRFDGEEVPTLKSMDEEGIVVYCSSFSKILSPGIRLGFVVAPDPIAQKMVVAKQSEDVHTNIFFQILCYRFLTEYDLDAHIRRLRALYGKKCRRMLDCLAKELPPSVKFTRPQGGLFVWCTLPEGTDAAGFIRACVDKNLRIVPGVTFNADTEAPSRCFRLNYSMPSEAQIEEGCRRLGEVARQFVKS